MKNEDPTSDPSKLAVIYIQQVHQQPSETSVNTLAYILIISESACGRNDILHVSNHIRCIIY